MRNQQRDWRVVDQTSANILITRSPQTASSLQAAAGREAVFASSPFITLKTGCKVSIDT